MENRDYLYKIVKESFIVSDMNDDMENEVNCWLEKTPAERFIALEIS
jgi:hypothetical protein